MVSLMDDFLRNMISGRVLGHRARQLNDGVVEVGHTDFVHYWLLTELGLLD